MIAAGIDLGGTKIEAQVFADDWTLADRQRWPTPHDYALLVAAMVAAIRWCETHGSGLPIGVSAAGLVNPLTGTALTSNLPATGKPFPQDPHAQLWGAIGAVFGSWMNTRANTYRRLHDIPASWGTAVNVQAMVFGNMGEDCATGVCFTRDPSTGENMFYGEYLVNAQGEDVVAGIRTPQPMSSLRAKPGEKPMEEVMPAAYQELVRVRDVLEKHYKDMQDIEFTVQQNKL